MVLDLVFRNSTKLRGYPAAFFRRALTAIIRELRLEGSVETSVNLVGLARMRTLNRKYREKDAPADVLSFPLHPGRAGLGDIKVRGYNDGALGDIFICPAHAAKKSKDYGMPLRDYLAWLTVHGFLHLYGYDHEKSQKEADAMFGLEEKILRSLKFRRPNF